MYKKCALEEIECLILTVLEDDVIKNRILELLQLAPFERRSVLNSWLEQLRLREASENLLSALSYLSDDVMARKMYALIKTSKLQHRGHVSKIKS
jgi:hypothetical protein